MRWARIGDEGGEVSGEAVGEATAPLREGEERSGAVSGRLFGVRRSGSG